MENTKPQISVIIPTINRYGDLLNTIQDLQNQTVQDFEIIIIDQTDAENARNLGKMDERINYTRSDIKSASAARNAGILKALSGILLFLDDDVIISNPGFLAAHIKEYKVESVPGVVGCVLEKRVNQQVRMDRHRWSEDADTGWLFFPQNYGKAANVAAGRSCNLSVRKNVALDVGGMDENFKKGAHREEADFCMRVYKKYGMFVFSPEAILVHIGNAQGGIRSWTKKTRILKAQHHYDGSLYFLFKNVRLRDYFKHGVSIGMFFFLNKDLLKKPHLVLVSLFRLFKGAINALLLLRKGPELI